MHRELGIEFKVQRTAMFVIRRGGRGGVESLIHIEYFQKDLKIIRSPRALEIGINEPTHVKDGRYYHNP